MFLSDFVSQGHRGPTNPSSLMRPARKIALGLGALVALLFAALLALPAFFGDRIESRVKVEVNRSVNAHVAWGASSLSLLRHFPNVSLTLDRLTVAGIAPFERDTLLAIQQARLVLDLGSVLGYLRSGHPIVIREIALEQPAVNLRRLPDGRANWDITRKGGGAAADTTRAVGVTLRDLRIAGGMVTLDDRQARLSARVTGLEESLRGDFARDRFVLSTRTRGDSVSLSFGGISYLNRVSLDVDANIDADLPAHRFTLTNDSLRLNKLVLALSGTVTTGTPDLGLDLAFSAPSTAFAEILSLVPAIYARDFEQLQTGGTMSMSGRVRGAYGPRAFPALAVRARVDNGSFRYPDLALPARDIAMDLAIDNPGGNVDSTVVDLKRFHATIGARPLDARLVVRTPVSDPDADLRLTGALDLADLARTVKLQGVSELAGVVGADVAMHARVSDVDARRYDRVAASGAVQAAHVAVRSATLPHPIAVDTAALRLTPRTAELTAFSGKIGSSDVRATGSLDNVLGFLLRNEDLRGSATVSSDHFDLNEWRSSDKTTEVIPVPPRVDFALRASAARVTYGALTMANMRGDLQVKNQRVTLNDVQMEMLRGSVVANGFYETVNAGRPAFGMDVRLTSLDIPAAFAALTTVRALMPIARWAQGNVSGTVALNGTLGRDMTPVFAALTGKGAVETERLVLQNAPVLDKLANALSLEQLRAPGLGAVRASFDVADGRVHVKPFTVKANGIDMTVSGSNGIDQSLDYDLALAAPRALLGAAATSVVAKLAAQAGKVGAELPAGEVVRLRSKVAGTVTNPTITTNFAGMAASARDAAQSAAQEMAAAAVETAKQKADSATSEATRRARAEADRIVAEAGRQADSIRAGGRALADRIRREGNARIDSLVARATNPVARLAAQKTADRLRKEADQQAERVIRDADAQADALVAQAKQKAGALVPPGG